MKELTLECKTITPMFLAGADEFYLGDILQSKVFNKQLVYGSVKIYNQQLHMSLNDRSVYVIT